MNRPRNRCFTSKTYKREYIRIAKELHYSQEVIEKLEQAQSEEEASHILSEARMETYERDLKNMSKR